MTLILKKALKRKAGTRAGLTKPAIVAAGVKLLGGAGVDAFSIRALAKSMKVSPTSIHAHFKGGYSQLTSEMARAIIAELTPPFTLQEDPKDYLRKVFDAALFKFRQRPVLGHFAALRLANDPLIAPVFAERILAIVTAIGAEHDLARALRIVVSRLGEMILSETAELALSAPGVATASILERIAGLPGEDFPWLVQAAEQIASDSNKRSDPEYFATLVDETVSALIVELTAVLPPAAAL